MAVNQVWFEEQKNDEVATGLVDATVEPLPLPCSTDFVSCLFISALAFLLWSKFSNDLMALRMILGFVFVQSPTSNPGICSR